jgi:hypothetical protein
MNFKLEHHQKDITILNSFDATILRESFTYFGGGTLIALLFDEYRQSNLEADNEFRNVLRSLFTSGFRSILEADIPVILIMYLLANPDVF